MRAISIVLVILSHVLGSPNLPNPGLRTDMMGNLGVRVFFVISGYLITRLLLHELDATGSVNLPRFYLRRSLRIFPAFYAYLSVLVVLSKLGTLELGRFDLREALTYTVNYFSVDAQSHWIRHLWSLSNEEQFYLVWPACLVLLKRRWAMPVAAAAILLMPFWRLALILTGALAVQTIDRRFDCVADALACGCLLAGFHVYLSSAPRYLGFLRSSWFLAVPAAALLGLGTQDHPRIYYVLGQTVMNLGIALCIDRCVRLPGGRFGYFLNAGSIRQLGFMSYSLYLWQQLFLVPDGRYAWQAFPLNIGLTAAAGWISYKWIENPFRRLYSKHSISSVTER